MSKSINFSIACSIDDVNDIKDDLDKIKSINTGSSEVKGISGITEAMIFGSVSIGLVSKVIELVKNYLDLKKTIKSLSIGEDEIKNPTIEMLDEKMKQYAAS